MNSLFACWFEPAQISQPTVFFSHKKPTPVSLNQHQHQHQPANRPEDDHQLLFGSDDLTVKHNHC